MPLITAVLGIAAVGAGIGLFAKWAGKKLTS